MEAYFDNSATTKVLDCVKDAVVDAMCVNYGNAAAKHRKGVEAENLIREAKKAIADTLKVQEKEILFTSGGTESNNTALIGTALANRRAGKHLITTGVEHPSIYNTMSFLEEMGFEVTYLPVDHLGHISLEDLEKAIREDTILVSVMYVNNEVGAVEPIEAISQCIKKKNTKTLDTRSMRRRASDSSISATVSRSARFCLAAASRRACVPVRKMCRGVSDSAWQHARRTKILMHASKSCIHSGST